MSPFLFTLVANGFSALMTKVVNNGFIRGFDASHYGPSIAHLQFADDTICFVEVSIDQVSNLKLILKIYKCISGFEVNIAKSSMVGMGVDDMALS